MESAVIRVLSDNLLAPGLVNLAVVTLIDLSPLHFDSADHVRCNITQVVTVIIRSWWDGNWLDCFDSERPYAVRPPVTSSLPTAVLHEAPH